MAKTKVLLAPYNSAGSLMHYPNDARRFLYCADPETGERLERNQIWERIENPDYVADSYSSRAWGRAPMQIALMQIERQIRPFVQIFSEIDWRPNEPFRASLQVDHMRSGRSAKYVMLKPVNSPLDLRTYPMFISDLLDVIQRFGIERGSVMSGRWMASKRGQNYGLRAAKDGE